MTSVKNQKKALFEKFSNWALEDYLNSEPDPFEKAKIHLTFNLALLNFIAVVVILIKVILTQIYFSVINGSFVLFLILIVIGVLKYKKDVKLASILFSVFSLLAISLGAIFNDKIIAPFNVLFFVSIILYTFFTLGKKWGIATVLLSSFVWVFYIKNIMYENLHNETVYINTTPYFTVLVSFTMITYTIIQFVNMRTYAENKIKENNEELKKAKEIAEQALKIQEQFFANTSHEIRTPINGIMGMTRHLMETPTSKEQKEYLNAIKESSNNLVHVINDILDISKIRANKIVFEKTEFKLSDLFKTLQFTLQYKSEEKNINLKSEISNEIPSVLLGDPVRLNQILLNLAGNAIKFTDHGGVLISAKKTNEENKIITINFSVTDTGIGIDKNKIDYIFEAFAQAEAHTTRKFGGTGLGLSISKSLIEQQGGAIKVESELGKGSTFSFNLKFEIGNPAWNGAQIKDSGSIVFDLSGINVLLVDDNKINQRLAQFDLKKWNTHVDIYDDAKSAIDQLLKKDYDIILMDISMPGMNGFEATKYIRSNINGVKKNIPIIAMTASALAGEKEKCLNAGMNDYISKPFNPITLNSKIAKWTKNKNIEYKKNIESNSSTQNNQRLTDLKLMIEHSDGNSEYIKTIIDIYIKTIPQDLKTLNEDLGQSRWESVADISHKIKTSVAYIGASRIYDSLNEIETEIKNDTNNIEQINLLVNDVNNLCDISIKELINERQKLS